MERYLLKAQNEEMQPDTEYYQDKYVKDWDLLNRILMFNDRVFYLEPTFVRLLVCCIRQW